MPAGLSDTSILALVGPTAVGKTSLALRISEQTDIEIISADSRQIYRELTIGTAKPTADELRRVPHHFVNELDLPDPYSAGRFARDGYKRIRDVLDKGCKPIVVGGSTLYIQALVHGLAPIPAVSAEVRKAVEGRLSEEGNEALFRELEQVDPVSANGLDSTKTQRLVRALEVYYETGCPLSSFFSQQDPPPYSFDVRVLTMDRSRLYERINERVDVMLNEGLLGEVESLVAAGFDRYTPALKTIGYQEPLAFLAGEITEEEMVRLIKRNSRRYAKRQFTWFRRYNEEHWLEQSNAYTKLRASQLI